MKADDDNNFWSHRRFHIESKTHERGERLRLSTRGFTLLELLIVITLIGILATIAVPNFQEMVKRNAVVSQNNELVALINTAKSEAVRRSTAVRIVIVDLGSGTWQATVRDPDTDEELRTTANPRVILADKKDPSIGNSEITFNSRGYLGASWSNPDEWNTGGITLRLEHINCTVGSPGQGRDIQIRPTGQIEGTPYAC